MAGGGENVYDHGMMRKLHQRSRRHCLAVLVALAAAATVTGCGVKSAPKHPEGSTYPLDYPRPAAGDTRARPEPEQRGGPVDPYQGAVGYQPPPAATDIRPR